MRQDIIIEGLTYIKVLEQNPPATAKPPNPIQQCHNMGNWHVYKEHVSNKGLVIGPWRDV